MAGSVVSLGKEEIERICEILDFESGNKVAISEFERSWALLTIDLCNYNHAWRIKWIKRVMKSRELTFAGAFAEILWDWVEWNVENATLGNLLSVLRENRLDTFAELISNEFYAKGS